jgi:hypothetical protein
VWHRGAATLPSFSGWVKMKTNPGTMTAVAHAGAHEWILDREHWESDEESREAAAFWRRKLRRTDRDGISISQHLKAGRAVLIELKL